MNTNTVSTTTASLEGALSRTSHLLATDPALAAEQANEILRTVGPHPGATLMLGIALDRCGRGRIVGTPSRASPTFFTVGDRYILHGRGPASACPNPPRCSP